MESKGITELEFCSRASIVMAQLGVLGDRYVDLIREGIYLSNLKGQLRLVMDENDAIDFVAKIYSEAIQLPGRNYDYMVSKLKEKIDVELVNHYKK